MGKRRNEKRKCAGICILLAALILSGCGMNEEDAAAYVEATLDANYKGEFGDYVEITDSTVKEAKKLYENNMQVIEKSVGIEDMPKELAGNYEKLFQDILAKTSYEVKEGKKSDDGFEVTVETKELQLFGGLEDELIEKTKQDLSEEKDVPDEEEIDNIAMENLYELLSDRLEGAEYGEAKKITVHVVKDEEGVFMIPEKDLLAVDEALFL